jgi:hypothetical protein
MRQELHVRLGELVFAAAPRHFFDQQWIVAGTALMTAGADRSRTLMLFLSAENFAHSETNPGKR